MNEYFDCVRCGSPQDLTERATFSTKLFRGKAISKRTGEPFLFDHFNAYLCLLLRHYGFAPSIKRSDLERTAVDGYTAYFAGISDRRGVIKKRKDVVWYQPFVRGSLACLVFGNHAAFSKLASFVRADLDCEPLAIPEPSFAGEFAALLASHADGVSLYRGELIESLHKVRAARAKALLSGYQSIFEKPDQTKLCSALNASVSLFAKKSDDGVPLVAIAELESLLANLAIQRGMSIDDCELPTRARLLTENSVFEQR